MRARVSCPTCSKAYVVDDHLKGKLIRCKQCNTTFKATPPEDADKIQPAARATMPEPAAKSTSRSGGAGLDSLARWPATGTERVARGCAYNFLIQYARSEWRGHAPPARGITILGSVWRGRCPGSTHPVTVFCSKKTLADRHFLLN
jgi:predicted Zn finger-like uncharacterized protein